MKRFVLLLALASSSARADTDADLVAKLGADEWADREAAMHAALDRPGIRPLLEEAARSADPEVRWRAEWALGCLDWGIDTATAREIGNPLDRWKNLEPAELATCIDAVERIGRPSRVGILLRMLQRFEDPSLRTRALALLRVEKDGFRDWAKARLASEDAVERAGAALALGYWRDPAGLEELKRQLAMEKPAYGRDETITALACLGSEGAALIVGAIRDAIAAKKLPSLRELAALGEAPIGTGEVEETLLRLIETDWPEGVDASEATTLALDTLARCAGPKAADRLAAWWQKDPAKRARAVSVAVSVADAGARKALATRVAETMGGEQAKPDDLFLVAAMHRLAGNAEEHRKAVDRLAAAEAFPAGFERVAEVALTKIEAGDAKGAEEYLKKAMAADEGNPVYALLRMEAAKAQNNDWDRGVDRDYNEQSWGLVTEPDRLAHPGLAVRLSEWTMKATKKPEPRGTLGAAYYRAGRFDEAIKTLEINLEIPYDGKQEDMAFLAMAYKKAGRVDDAKSVDAKCREWESKDTRPNPLRPELERVLRE